MSRGGLWRLTVRDEFAAAHALRHYQGKCEQPHGHNFGVELCVEGRSLAPDTELLLDFATLKGLLRAALAKLDHCMLNEQPPFDALNPSSENLARHIFQEIAAGLAQCQDPQAAHVRLVSVSVSERQSQSATYLEP